MLILEEHPESLFWKARRIMKIRYKLFFTIIVTLVTACGSAAGPENWSDQFAYDLHDGLCLNDVAATAGALENNIDRIASDLQVEELPVVTVGMWSDYDNFLQAMEDDLGTVYYGATGYVFGMDEIRVFQSADAPEFAVHEFSHLVSLHVNTTIPNNPRWLWEAVALYEAQQFVNPATLPYMVQGDYPTLLEMSDPYSSSNTVYQVGYVLMEFTVDSWGANSVIQLILSNGDIDETLGISVSEYEAEWYTYLEETYL